MRRSLLLKTLLGSAVFAAVQPAFARTRTGNARDAEPVQPAAGMPDWAGYEIKALAKEHAESNRPYLEFLRVPSLTCGLYVLSVGGEDKQTPHRNDEIYYVVSGRAVLTAGGDEQRVGPGSVVYVRAGVEHRFKAIEEELRVLVFFALNGGAGGS